MTLTGDVAGGEAVARPAPFNACARNLVKGDVPYRVYVREGELYFIRMRNRTDWRTVALTLLIMLGVSGQVGLVRFCVAALAAGYLVYLVEKRDARARTEEARWLDERDPHVLVQTVKESFARRAADVAWSSIEKPGIVTRHDGLLGNWRIEFRGGQRERLQLETISDMTTALTTLPPILGRVLAVNVEWDPARKRFERRRDATTQWR